MVEHRSHVQQQHHNSSEASRRWSMDAADHPGATQTQRTADRDHVTSPDPTQGLRRALETTLQQPTRRKYGTALARSQSADGPIWQPYAPRMSSRSSLAEWSPLQFNSPSRLDRTSWSFVTTSNNSGPETALSLPGSPSSRSRPGSASLLRESLHRAPRALSYTGDTIVHNRDQDDDYPHRSRTPATLRPASAALQPITEGTSIDQDTSLADTSTFFYDRFRFSSFSTRSDLVETSPRSSPMPAASTGSITSSKNTNVSSTTGSPSAFKPRQLMITRSSSLTGTEPYSHMSRTNSRRLLRSASAQSVQVARNETARRDIRETVRPRFSEVVCSTPVQNTNQAKSPPEQTTDDNPEQTCNVADDDLRSVDGSDLHAGTGTSAGGSVEMSSVKLNSDKTGDSPRHDRCAPSEILIPQPSIPCMLPIDDYDAASKSASAPSWPEFNKVRSTLSPSGEYGSASLSKARSSSSPSSGDQSSLSAPRSAASADSRSSEAVEVVPWQVATTDSDGVRKSEEIFRPLSLVQSGRGSSNTVIPGILPSAASSAGSRASTVRKMPPTPLKGVSGTEWANRSSRGDVNLESDMFSRLTDESIGLGISPLPLRAGEQQLFAKTSVAGRSRPGSLQSRKLKQDHAILQTKVERQPSQTGHITSPPGGMDRLLSELDPVTTDSQLRRKVEAAPILDYGIRSSSLRRYHPHGGHVGLGLPRRPEKDAVTFDHHDIDRRLPARCSRQVDSISRSVQSPLDVSFAGATGRTGLNAANRNVSPKHPDASEVQRTPRFLRLAISLGAFMMIYQTLFFIFEAPYWWITFSPALPLAAAALFLLSDGLIIQLLLQRSSNRCLLLCALGMSVLSLLYCVVLSVWITLRLIRSPDGGASAPGIHFDRSRDTVTGGSVLQDVLRDMPMPVVLAGIGTIGVVMNAGWAMWLWCRLPSSRHGDIEGQ
ncbi:palmitoyltransferase [Pseudozyma hubeiensis SY62]|uniref:Palmitoyltransferase n=1 Tax=Pseudozyma hubeiensis (strain SY62) TaxID=1305764 RepID=R9P1B8_PSEHS|nr:palmitoyltransferase [Pseudozyma hubeiensis SY62]GAC94892.1 palmitoyltransferase [Pseudozyma hubeiensis SY62]